MHLKIANFAQHGGKRANALAAQLREQAGLTGAAADHAFDTLLARARESAAAKKRN